MSKKFVEKNIKLSLEFDKYLAKNPRAYNKIPKGACIVITQKGDKVFNKTSMTIAKSAREEKQKCVEARKEGTRWILQPLGV